MDAYTFSDNSLSLEINFENKKEEGIMNKQLLRSHYIIGIKLGKININIPQRKIDTITMIACHICS
jgi:hypothetical protein